MSIAKLLKISVFTAFAFIAIYSNAYAADGGGEDKTSFILHHVKDSHEWHFWDGPFGTLHLPVMLYSKDRGFEVFSTANFFDENHKIVEFNGYKYDHGHIVPLEEGRSVIDFSITKNVAMLFITIFVVLFLTLKSAAHYKKNPNAAPKGIASFIEPIVVFIRDEIAKPNIGKSYARFVPYLLTLFFFIWFGNLLGLLPGAANLTGNIAVTAVLAVLTLIITNVNGNKHYWKHIFATPGVPIPILFIMVPVEILSIFTKPASLALRLFVAITAGHIVILSLLGLTFIFESYAVGVASTLIVFFINLIELLVATIQAYIFTLFTSMYIGSAVADDHH